MPQLTWTCHLVNVNCPPALLLQAVFVRLTELR